jgi:hypothetical protein
MGTMTIQLQPTQADALLENLLLVDYSDAAENLAEAAVEAACQRDADGIIALCAARDRFAEAENLVEQLRWRFDHSKPVRVTADTELLRDLAGRVVGDRLDHLGEEWGNRASQMVAALDLVDRLGIEETPRLGEARRSAVDAGLAVGRRA